jgi:CRISPR-associated endoribonuclease Cas6
MITKYKFFFKSDSKLPNYLGPCFQSIFLSSLDSELAENLHQGEHNLRPYRNAVYKTDDKYIWELVILNERLAEAVNSKLSSLLQDHYLKAFDVNIKYLGNYECYSTSHKKLFKEYYSPEFTEKNFISLSFKTPTTIKTQGRYLHYPREDLILFSLLKKWDDFSDDVKLYDSDLYETISNNLQINSIKKLKSQFMTIDKGKVSGFVGEIDFKIKSPTRQINQLINLLLNYSNYCGIGIKTAMGMGSVIAEISIKK